MQNMMNIKLRRTGFLASKSIALVVCLIQKTFIMKTDDILKKSRFPAIMK